VNNDTSKKTLLVNARIVFPDRIAEATNILVEGGRIARIFSVSDAEPAGIGSRIDLDGRLLFPGFIDIHLHGAMGVDVLEATPQDLDRVSGFLARNGVTAWVPTIVPSSPEHYSSAVRAIEIATQPGREDEQAGSLRSSRILGVHYEGPFVNTAQCGALHQEHFRSFKTPADLDSLPTINNQGAVHLITVAPEIDGGIELVRELHRRGWIVSIGHTRATPEILDQAVQAGARHMTHFMNAMPQLHHRAPGPVGWGLTRDEVTCDVIADGIHLDPSILKLILRSKTAARISLISDAIAAAGLGDGEYQIWGETIKVENGRTQNGRGNIAGSVITMLDAVRMMLSLGASEPEVAAMASLNPARLLGIAADTGSIEEGKRADMVALDKDCNVRMTLIGGHPLASS
jgi:N-acetylglucosamine-6-phosphate deacetylase